MNAKYLIVAMIETIIKIAILAAVVVFVFRGATQADQPVSVSGGRTITIGVSENASVREVAQMLEERGLIEDSKLFIVQELLSAYHNKILPGIYDLSTDMTAEQMLEVMSTPTQAEGEDGGQE